MKDRPPRLCLADHLEGAPPARACLSMRRSKDSCVRVIMTPTMLYDRCYPELQALETNARYRELLARIGLQE